MYEQGKIAFQVPILSMRYARHFCHFMEIRGINRPALIEGTALTNEILDNTDGFLTMTETLCLFGKASMLLDDERLPFQFGQSLDLMKHGLLGHSLLYRSDIKTLVLSNLDYLGISLPLMKVDVSVENNIYTINLEDIWDLGNLRDFVAKIYMGSIYTLLSMMNKTIVFNLDASTALQNSDWSKLVDDTEIHFNSSSNSITMTLAENQSLNNEYDIADFLAETNTHHSLERDGSLKVLNDVRQHITDDPGRGSTLERIAPLLGMCTRSVRRHLTLAGHSFQSIRNEIREAYATRYLIDTRLPLEIIASRLGYCDQAGFTKAYRIWTGNTPGNVRRLAVASENMSSKQLSSNANATICKPADIRLANNDQLDNALKSVALATDAPKGLTG